jgi:2-dehydro-3-deoxyphosphogluconate aldolase/(4S)-4-hydroxy-2-oxoglutarate aldolase
MSRYTRLQVYNTLLESRLVPLFYHSRLETAQKIVAAVQAGGGRVIEFTNRGDLAYPVFSALSQHLAQAEPGLILGVGSVIDAPTAAMYIAAGANFVVGPLFNPEVARLCNRRKIAYLPGCGSVSEISQAEEWGAEIIKIFPGGAVGGPAFIKAVLGPLPWARLMPTGGVEANPESIQKWFKAGACAVGMGSDLISKEMISNEDYHGIAQRVAQVIQWIQEAV